MVRVRREYGKATTRGKTRLLSEALERTTLNPKVLIRADVWTALVKIWEISDFPRGQRLAHAVRAQLDRRRQSNEDTLQ